MNILSQTLVPLEMAIMLWLQESEGGLESSMMKQTTLLYLVHNPTQKFK